MITVLAVLFLGQTLCSAQIPNRLGVDDEIFAKYAAARVNVYSKDNIALGDSLYNVGVQRSDPRIEILGLNLEFPPMFVYEEYDRADEVAAQIRDIAVEHRETEEIYYAAHFTYVQLLLSAGRSLDALMATRKMIDLSKDGSLYGKFLAYRSAAYIYIYREDSKTSADYLRKALEVAGLADTSTWGGDLDYTKIQLAMQLASVDVEQAEELLEEVKDSPYLKGLILGQLARCMVYMNKLDSKDFCEAYEELVATPNYEYQIDQSSMNQLSALYDAFSGKYDLALEKASEIPSALIRYQILEKIHYMRGDYKSAYLESAKIRPLVDSLAFIATQEDMAVFDAEMENDILRHEAELARTKMQTVTVTCVMILVFILTVFLFNAVIRSKKHLRELQEANEVKERFVMNISHEIRTPLNAILGYSQLLCLPDGSLSEEEKEEFEAYITDNSSMLTMMLDDLLNANDIQSGVFKIKMEDTSPLTIATAAVRTSENRRPGGVELCLDNSIPEGFRMHTDPRRVNQILSNLLSNSCKNTTEGSIVLHCSLDGSHVVFDVTDTGCGIPEDCGEKIFERFYKVDDFKPGVGLGLTISRELASLLGGSLVFDPSHTPGSRFILTLPVSSGK